MANRTSTFAVAGGVVGIAALAMIVAWPRGPSTPKQSTPAPGTATSTAPRVRQSYNYAPVQGLKAGMPLRPMDFDILQKIEEGTYKREDMPDLFPNRPYQVRLVGSPVEHWIYTVMIDLERDGKWDERWEMKKDRVVRYTIGGGEDQDNVPWALRPGHWLPF
jgi:hypothetical protein